MKKEWKNFSCLRTIETPVLVFCMGYVDEEMEAYLALCDSELEAEITGTLVSEPETLVDVTVVITDLARQLIRSLEAR